MTSVVVVKSRSMNKVTYEQTIVNPEGVPLTERKEVTKTTKRAEDPETEIVEEVKVWTRRIGDRAVSKSTNLLNGLEVESTESLEGLGTDEMQQFEDDWNQDWKPSMNLDMEEDTLTNIALSTFPKIESDL